MLKFLKVWTPIATVYFLASLVWNFFGMKSVWGHYDAISAIGSSFNIFLLIDFIFAIGSAAFVSVAAYQLIKKDNLTHLKKALYFLAFSSFVSLILLFFGAGITSGSYTEQQMTVFANYHTVPYLDGGFMFEFITTILAITFYIVMLVFIKRMKLIEQN